MVGRDWNLGDLRGGLRRQPRHRKVKSLTIEDTEKIKIFTTEDAEATEERRKYAHSL
jgi:hypothetical protein